MHISQPDARKKIIFYTVGMKNNQCLIYKLI